MDIMNIPLDDPEANRAAAKIQAGFRGHMDRKKLKPEGKIEEEKVSNTGNVFNSSQGSVLLNFRIRDIRQLKRANPIRCNYT